MRSIRFSALVAAVLMTAASGVSAAQAIHHSLTLSLDPATHVLSVADALHLGEVAAREVDGAYPFVLHAGMNPELASPNWTLERTEGEIAADFFGINATTDTVSDTVPLEGFLLVPGEGARLPVTIRYEGPIHHALEQQGEEYQRSFSETPGIIDDVGIFLSGTTFWIPTFGDGLVTFDLTVEGLPEDWQVVSQGKRTRHETDTDGRRVTTWAFSHPTEEIYLVGGPLTEYADRQGEVDVFAFLRTPDPTLATRYLDATKRYLRLYDGMLPSFPFASFALVENFWETGYGMPGFTLLGPKVIRFPWILTSSYPHELLHNWWGNSAYVDFDRGNWCEGLTAYMADHLFAEQRGEGAVYRRSTLKKFSDLVSTENDFPLVEFHSRHSGSSEAVGYGKSLMLFHMMRRSIGDEAFLRAMTRFYEDQQFRRAGFDDFPPALAAIGGGEWDDFIEAWTTRTGAPQLEIASVAVLENPGDENRPWLLEMKVDQMVEGDLFPLTVPVAVTLEGAEEALWAESGTCGGDCVIRVPCASKPLRIDVDPAFDVMRRLDPREVPPAISTLMGAEDILFILPAAAPEDEQEKWKNLAASWAAPDEARIALDSEIEVLPEETLWILGWKNAFADEVAGRLEEAGVTFDGRTLGLSDEIIKVHERSTVLVARGQKDPSVAVGWVTADPVAAIPGLERKLPHYQKYSYLAFRGEEPENTHKGMWSPVGSPLVRNLSEGPMPDLVLPTRKALAELPPLFEAESFGKTVRFLADPALEGRGLGSPGLEKATAWVEERMREIGLEPAGDGDTYRQSWRHTSGEPAREMALSNLLGRIPGKDPQLVAAPVVVMAHLDHLGRGWPDVREGNQGKIHPGADDNASGVAVLLELARALKAEPPRARPIVFAVVTGEEAGLLGSRHYMENLPEDAQTFACVNLDTVGRLKDGKLYILNGSSAREWRFIFMGVGYTTGAPVAVVTEELDASDQVACLEKGVPAVQLFTGPTATYHRPTDTVEKLDLEGMATVTEAAKETVAYLAERVDALTVTIDDGPKKAASEHPGAAQAGRRASLGTMPDFAFSGPGVRVQAVTPESAAAKAGIQAGDIVLKINDASVEGLRGLSGLLKTHQPGDTVTVGILRGAEEIEFEVVLGAR